MQVNRQYRLPLHSICIQDVSIKKGNIGRLIKSINVSPASLDYYISSQKDPYQNHT
jgi:hypothetical protein